VSAKNIAEPAPSQRAPLSAKSKAKPLFISLSPPEKNLRLSRHYAHTPLKFFHFCDILLLVYLSINMNGVGQHYKFHA
ncbi:MAG: hypothetical protein LUH49_03450, partial [Cloacibacillus porcorum]|uniref:hypothetical protein n=1 Tax=Cloacibacillus porcorum TaxID=1197717 RepID=UPI0023F4E1E9